MEYERTEDGQIQADFAGRVGQILVQYESFKGDLPADQRFEATLAVTLLQAILTQCQELLKRAHDPAKAPKGLDELVAMSNRGFDDPPPLLGLTQACIQERWPSTQTVKYRDLIECIRNALSHPQPQSKEGLPRTGFTTHRGGSGCIESFVFTQSPWVDFDGRLDRKFQARRDNQGGIDRANKAITGWGGNRGVSDVVLQEQAGGQFLPSRIGELFVPVMRVRLDVKQLRLLVLGLSDYLTAPLQVSQQSAPTAQV